MEVPSDGTITIGELYSTLISVFDEEDDEFQRFRAKSRYFPPLIVPRSSPRPARRRASPVKRAKRQGETTERDAKVAKSSDALWDVAVKALTSCGDRNASGHVNRFREMAETLYDRLSTYTATLTSQLLSSASQHVPPALHVTSQHSHVIDLAYHPSLPILAILIEDGSVYFFDMVAQRRLSISNALVQLGKLIEFMRLGYLPIVLRDQSRVSEFTWRPCGKSCLAVVGEEGVTLHHLPDDFATLQQDEWEGLPKATHPSIKHRIKRVHHPCAGARGLAWNGFGDTLAWTAPGRFFGGHLYLLDIYDGACQSLFMPSGLHSVPQRGLVFAPDSGKLACANDRKVYVWECARWTHIVKVTKRPITQIAFSPDAYHLLYACRHDSALRSLTFTAPPLHLGFRTQVVLRKAQSPEQQPIAGFAMDADGKRLLIRYNSVFMASYLLDISPRQITCTFGGIVRVSNPVTTLTAYKTTLPPVGAFFSVATQNGTIHHLTFVFDKRYNARVIGGSAADLPVSARETAASRPTTAGASNSVFGGPLLKEPDENKTWLKKTTLRPSMLQVPEEAVATPSRPATTSRAIPLI